MSLFSRRTVSAIHSSCLAARSFLLVALLTGPAWSTAAKAQGGTGTLPPDLIANNITITKGGTYSGNWVSTDPATPAVLVLTDDPVVIENSTVTGRGNLIVASGTAGANLTVRNVSARGLDPLTAGKQRGAFVVAYVMKSLAVQHCTITGTSFGVKAGFSTVSSLSISNNLVTDLEDRASDGNGGFLTTRPQLGHFALLYQVTAPSGAEIAWNQVSQTMGQSSVDDVISVYKSQGSSTLPIRVHDNYMDGYSSPAATFYNASGLSSTGDDALPVSAFVLFENNQMLHTAGNGISVLSGHDITAKANHVVSCGEDGAGTWYAREGSAAVLLWNRAGSPGFANNTITQTAGGLVIPNTANRAAASDVIANPVDLLTTSNSVSGNLFSDPCLAAGATNLQAEDAERGQWFTKLTAFAQTVGDLHSPVQIAVTPATVSLGPSGTLRLSATVTWASNPSVTWSMSPAMGTVGSDGLYTAPSNIPASQAVTVTATSVADASKSASATIQLVAPVSISVAPSTASITSAQRQTFSATVQNSSNTGVVWSISPALGNISATGVYAPPALLSGQQTVTVTATSVADGTKSSSAKLTITPVAIAISPVTVSLAAAQSQQFAAMLQNAPTNNILWSIAPSFGSISASGLYTAPSVISNVQTVTITAANAADTTQWVTGTITLLPPVKVNLLANYAALTVSQSAQFNAAVQNTTNPAVTWSILPSIGRISSQGLYTAPGSIAAQQTVTFTATSVADATKSATGSITLTPPVSVAVVPASATLSPSSTQQFAGNVAWSKNTAVVWSVNPAAGTISSTGLYTAPSGTTVPQQVVVTATSAADLTKSDSATITLNPPVSVAVTPATATVTRGQTQLLTAQVNYSTNPAVTWSISPSLGSISASGRYSPPATAVPSPQTVVVTAASVSDPSQHASATLTVNPPALVVATPANASLAASQSQQFSAAVQYSASSAVIWSITPALGSITAQGLYTAPASINNVQAVTITATLANDPSNFASASLTLLPPVKVNFINGYAAITASQTAQFTAAVQNASNTAVSWSISPAVGYISASGLYTAPQSVTVQQTISITATSVADNSKTATGTVVINPPVSVAVVPQNVTLPPSAAQQFAGNVAWSSNTAVTWSISPALGTVSANGLYTAPADTTSPRLVTLTATSVADSSKLSSTTITLNPPPSVSINPVSTTLTTGQTQLFTASVQYAANPLVTWSISPATGTISAGGRYTPPAAPVSTPQTITVTATSVADPTRSANALVTINPVAAVTVTPAVTSLTGSQQLQFNAAVQWTANPSVSWSLIPSVGTITAAGLYTAPASISTVQQVTVTAVSASDNTRYATATVTLLPPVKINLVSSYASVAASGSTSFTAQVQNTPDARVSWAINPVLGNISSAGIYTAPGTVSTQQTISVTATSVADPTKTASGTIVVNPPVAVAVVPSVITLRAAHTQQMNAYVAWSGNTAVTWSMSPNIGTLSASGVYIAPDTVPANQAVVVTATSVADSTKSASAVITLQTLLGPAPIVIPEARTYSGNWISTDPNVPAVTVNTDAPVIIQNATVRGSGNLIQIIGSAGANVAISNVTGTATDPLVSGRQRGAFIRAAMMNTLSVRNCTMTGGAFGIQVSSSTLSTLSIIGNKGVNLEDRASDGSGGLQVARPQLGHFIVLHNVVAPNGAEIAWNQLQQTIGQSSTEDVVNIYHSQGASSNPIRVHDNYMEGYSSTTTPTYTGNGLISDGDSQNVSAYILFQANQMVHTAGGGVAIASGHDVIATANRVVSCGVDSTGQWYSRPGTAAVALWNYYGAPQFYNNVITQTVGGLVSPSPTRQPTASDMFINAADTLDSSNSVAGNFFTDPCLVNGQLNDAAEDQERAFWSTKLQANGVFIGDLH